MADSSGRGAGKPSSGGPGTPGGAKVKGRRTQGGRVVESRYLQYEKKTTKKASAADVSKTSGKAPESTRRVQLLQKSKGFHPSPGDSSGVGKGDLQSTLLEGHGTAPPDLDLSAINDKSMVRKTPQLEKTMSKKNDSTSFSASQKSPDASEVMEMMESQTLLLTLLAVKVSRASSPHLLGELGIGSLEENLRAVYLLSELKEMAQKKDLELRRSFAQVLELSAEASKEASLTNQEAWEETQGLRASSRWYFNREDAFGETLGDVRPPTLAGCQ
ncbi:HAUS augmin-like complex subunit 8 [Suricata suricatta]|uniref:HAUS augmin-like complex subunit 8 n=1 Tax=Suricata suricatta TaxID=37032 RepID=UPI0011552CB9|nr:HAUS augmin-like complex subunit 8 [Suricata suricatta]